MCYRGPGVLLKRVNSKTSFLHLHLDCNSWNCPHCSAKKKHSHVEHLTAILSTADNCFVIYLNTKADWDRVRKQLNRKRIAYAMVYPDLAAEPDRRVVVCQSWVGMGEQIASQAALELLVGFITSLSKPKDFDSKRQFRPVWFSGLWKRIATVAARTMEVIGRLSERGMLNFLENFGVDFGRRWINSTKAVVAHVKPVLGRLLEEVLDGHGRSTVFSRLHTVCDMTPAQLAAETNLDLWNRELDGLSEPP